MLLNTQVVRINFSTFVVMWVSPNSNLGSREKCGKHLGTVRGCK